MRQLHSAFIVWWLHDRYYIILYIVIKVQTILDSVTLQIHSACCLKLDSLFFSIQGDVLLLRGYNESFGWWEWKCEEGRNGMATTINTSTKSR